MSFSLLKLIDKEAEYRQVNCLITDGLKDELINGWLTGYLVEDRLTAC